MNKEVKIYSAELHAFCALPFADKGIRAGFPSPAQDYIEKSLDLNEALIKHPASTFFGCVVGDSMKDCGLEEGDILFIDKSLTVYDGAMAVCFIDGEFTIKFIKKKAGGLWLMPANSAYLPIQVTSENDFMVWGIVTYSIKNRHKR